MWTREAKNAFGLMIDTAQAKPVLIEQHGRGGVIAVEVYQRPTVGLVTKRKNAERGVEVAKK